MSPSSIFGSAAFVLGAALAGCATTGATGAAAPTASVTSAPTSAPPATELVSPKVTADLTRADPMAAYWNNAPAGTVTLLSQPMITPRSEVVATPEIIVQSVHDESNLALRVRWKDPEPSYAGHLGQFSDAVAVQFPFKGDSLPLVMMGQAGNPVHIFHWRAQYQNDAEAGKPTMEQLYPNASVDMYAMDFHDAPGGSREEQEMFNPAVALGNPQSARKSGVDEVVAEGYSTSAVQASHGAHGVGVWNEGYWTVVINRPLSVDGGSVVVPGGANSVAFAVWQGGQGEVGSRKSVLMAWLPLKVNP